LQSNIHAVKVICDQNHYGYDKYVFLLKDAAARYDSRINTTDDSELTA